MSVSRVHHRTAFEHESVDAVASKHGVTRVSELTEYADGSSKGLRVDQRVSVAIVTTTSQCTPYRTTAA